MRIADLRLMEIATAYKTGLAMTGSYCVAPSIYSLRHFDGSTSSPQALRRASLAQCRQAQCKAGRQGGRAALTEERPEIACGLNEAALECSPKL